VGRQSRVGVLEVTQTFFEICKFFMLFRPKGIKMVQKSTVVIILDKKMRPLEEGTPEDLRIIILQ
jgi:hypothetical protein